MDLEAYANIDNLEVIAKKSNIEVPRLRGYRLMKDESPVDLTKAIDKKQITIDCVHDLCVSTPFWNTHAMSAEYSMWTDYICEYFLVTEKDENGYERYTDVRWDRIHGWKRKVLKTFIHNEIVRQRKQWEMWNKYAGKENILYIHARIGGGNWSYYFREVVGKPWFIEKVDDCFDSTYCDIYARIKPIE